MSEHDTDERTLAKVVSWTRDSAEEYAAAYAISEVDKAQIRQFYYIALIALSGEMMAQGNQEHPWVLVGQSAGVLLAEYIDQTKEAGHE